MRIVFLDIDGVLNNKASFANGIEIIPEKVLLVNEICGITGAKIVLSSAWRFSHDLSEIKFTKKSKRRSFLTEITGLSKNLVYLPSNDISFIAPLINNFSFKPLSKNKYFK